MKKTTIGVIIGILVLVAGFICYLYYYTHIQHNYDAPCPNCSSFVYWPFEEYSCLHEGWYPKGQLTPYDSMAELKTTKKFTPCHFSGHGKIGKRLTKEWKEKQTFTEQTTCYRYNEGLKQDDPKSLILLYYFKPTLWEVNWIKGNQIGRSIFRCAPFRIQFIPEAEFQKRQEATLKYIKDNNRVSPEKYKMLEEQYRKTLGEEK